MQEKICIIGAKENNLKNISLEIPRNQLVILTGVSGSGKTSLAFDTIYAEGQRRYVESLSAYARQFLGGLEKPDVESIEGLSPAISIDQKTTSNNPRSTVGTVTEIYDYLRLLYARVGVPYCPTHHEPITSQTVSEIVTQCMNLGEGTRLTICAPVVKNKKGAYKELLDKATSEGFVRAIIDGTMVRLDEEYEALNKNKKHDISLVIDRLVVKEENKSRLYDSIELANKKADGIIEVKANDKDLVFSTNYSCKYCGFSVPKLEPRLFSFNAPLGACEHCKGLGFTQEVDVDLLIPDRSKTIREGGIVYYKNIVDSTNLEWKTFKILMDYYGIDEDTPIQDLSDEQMEILLYGSKEPIKYTLTSTSGNRSSKYDFIEGVKVLIERRFATTSSEWSRDWYATFMKETTCTVCHGARLNKAALAVYVGDKNIIEFTQMSIDDALVWLNNLTLTPEKAKIAELILQEIHNRLNFLKDVGLNYLTLDRLAGTLSGGEAQRIRLATQIGSQLTGVLYVLDEPSIGLHQKDNDKLIDTLKKMRDLGNSVLVVEHDEDTMKASDWIVDIGPGAGVHGGQVIFNGTPKDILNCENSITGAYLSGRRKIEVPKKRRKGNGKYLEVIGASEHNLKNINVKIPLGTLTVVTGVSGSGKSTLVNETITNYLHKELNGRKVVVGKAKAFKGIENVDKIVQITQDPIGRTPRSNPATYTGVFDDIRNLFAMTQEAKLKGYDKGRFSFNVKGGRCEACWGDGIKRISMNFLPDVYVPCEVCHGKRYNEETLSVKYRGKSIYDVLETTVEEGLTFFENVPKIKSKLQTLYDVGLGYIKLGQSSTTLSGGEAQRVKLASELQKKATGKTLYVLDEPTTGLHSDDVNRLIQVLQRIVENGDSVLVIEHNLDVIKCADYIIDLGPDGGVGGGTVVACGTPEKVAENSHSYTGAYLKGKLNE